MRLVELNMEENLAELDVDGSVESTVMSEKTKRNRKN